LATIILLLLVGATRFDSTAPASTAPVRFQTREVFVDPKGRPLAAYQLELTSDPARVMLVGIEGGEHPAFANPPYYDPAALNHHRVILAAFSTSSDLPATRTRVATLHLHITADDERLPEFSHKLISVADSNGVSIAAEISISEGAAR
jgi:hypothetical protein